ncbi:hypothetical protein CPB86DRAFT_785984 [Serendipita vermifera]|nr:hypothetical protein CPB86DRAFT_785984 [Serendipita vermifera]
MSVLNNLPAEETSSSLDHAWKRSEFAKETSIWEPGHAFTQLAIEKGRVLLQSQSSRDIFILNTPSLESTGPISDSKRRVDCIHTKMLLKGSDVHFLLFKKSTKVYSIYWSDKEYSSEGKGAKAEVTGISEYDLNSFARHLVDVRIDSECEAIKMKNGCLMVVTARPTLYVFDLNSTISGAISSELAPVTTCDFTFAIDNPSPNQYIATSCIDFDEQCIFHCTDVGFRIVSRTTLEVLYSLHEEAPWQKVAHKHWTKCITSNAYIAPVSDSSGDQRLEWSHGGSRVTKLVKGTALQRKDAGWKWNAINMHVHDGMVIIVLLSGYAIGFPDYQNLINKEWNLNDGRGCWVLDVDKWCDWSACDGKRVVFAVRNRNVILNLHDLSNKMISADTSIVELSRNTWESSGAAGASVALTDRNLSFLASHGELFSKGAFFFLI